MPDPAPRASAPAHACEAGDAEVLIDIPGVGSDGGAGLPGAAEPEGEDHRGKDRPAAPPPLPRPAEYPYSAEVLAAIAAVLPSAACIQPFEVPDQVKQDLRDHYPPSEFPNVLPRWQRMGAEERAWWCAEALGREEVKAKPDRFQMRSASRHIGEALRGGIDLRAESRSGKVIQHPAAVDTPAAGGWF